MRAWLSESVMAAASARGAAVQDVLAEAQAAAARAASAHVAPFVIEATLSLEAGLQLYVVLRAVEDARAPGEVGVEEAARHGMELEPGDEALVQLFFAEDEDAQARAQDRQFLSLTGLPCVGLGLEPVVEGALRASLGLPALADRAALDRALAAAAAERGEDAVALRVRRRGAGLVLKRVVVVGADVRAADALRLGRRDLREGIAFEVDVRDLEPEPLFAALSERGDGRAELLARGVDLARRPTRKALAALVAAADDERRHRHHPCSIADLAKSD